MTILVSVSWTLYQPSFIFTALQNDLLRSSHPFGAFKKGLPAIHCVASMAPWHCRGRIYHSTIVLWYTFTYDGTMSLILFGFQIVITLAKSFNHLLCRSRQVSLTGKPSRMGFCSRGTLPFIPAQKKGVALSPLACFSTSPDCNI